MKPKVEDIVNVDLEITEVLDYDPVLKSWTVRCVGGIVIGIVYSIQLKVWECRFIELRE